MAQAQTAGSQPIDHRVDVLTILQADLPHLPAARHVVSLLGEFLARQALPRRQANHEGAPLPGQRIDVPFLDQFPRLQNPHPVTNQLHLAQQMRVQKNRLALVLELMQQIANFPPAHRVHAVGRLVEEDHFGIVEDRLSDAEPLFHALGISANLVVHAALEADQLQHFVNAPLAVAARHVEQSAVEIEQAVAGVVIGESVVLREVADATTNGCRPDRLTQQRCFAVGALGDAEQNLDHRRLAGSVLAEQAENFALLDAERHSLERFDPAVVLGQVVRLDNGSRNMPAGPAGRGRRPRPRTGLGSDLILAWDGNGRQHFVAIRIGLIAHDRFSLTNYQAAWPDAKGKV